MGDDATCMIWERQGGAHWRGVIITVLGGFGGLIGIGSFVDLLSLDCFEGEGETAEWNGSRLLVMKCDFLGCAYIVFFSLMACCGEVLLCLIEMRLFFSKASLIACVCRQIVRYDHRH
jgi:hypothetical protein